MIDSRKAEATPAPVMDAPRELTRAQIRIELLRLCQRPDVSPGDIIARAKEYETYVLDSNVAAYPAQAGPANERSRSRRQGQT